MIMISTSPSIMIVLTLVEKVKRNGASLTQEAKQNLATTSIG